VTPRTTWLHARLVSASVLLPMTACLNLPRPQPKQVTVVAVVLDLSPSASGSPNQRCDELAARARQAIADPHVRRVDLLALGTGDAASAMEPLVLVPWSRFEVSSALYEKRGRADAARGAWVSSVAARCRTAARLANGSAIYTSTKRALDSIRAHCAEVEGRREVCNGRLLYVHSDLRENVEPKITRRLGMSIARQAPASKDLPKLDVSDVAVTVCGVSETRGDHDKCAASPERVTRVWSEVFTPTAPGFDAACPVDRGTAEVTP